MMTTLDHAVEEEYSRSQFPSEEEYSCSLFPSAEEEEEEGYSRRRRTFCFFLFAK
jgi:hypothetical protein